MLRRLSSSPLTQGIAAIVVVSCLLMSPNDAQSGVPQRDAQARARAIAEIPDSVGPALRAGGEVTVTGVAPVGATVALTVSVAGADAPLVLMLAADAAHDLSLSPGRRLGAVRVDGGWLLMSGGEIVCFIAGDAARDRTPGRGIGA